MIYTSMEQACPDLGAVVGRLGQAIRAVGTDAFAPIFTRLMLESFRVSEFIVFQRASPNAAPTMLFSESADKMSANRAECYCRGFYKLDPIYSILDQDNPDGTFAIRVRADEIRNPAFRKTCYTQPGFAEKLTLASKHDGSLIAISVFARDSDGGFDEDQMDELGRFGQLLLPVLSLHIQLLGGLDRQKQVSSTDMEECVRWSFPELTDREVAVCARTILGVTAEGIALDLGIKQTSVLTYRRRAYARLNINSINQLSTMLIQSSAARQLAAA